MSQVAFVINGKVYIICANVASMVQAIHFTHWQHAMSSFAVLSVVSLSRRCHSVSARACCPPNVTRLAVLHGHPNREPLGQISQISAKPKLNTTTIEKALPVLFCHLLDSTYNFSIEPSN